MKLIINKTNKQGKFIQTDNSIRREFIKNNKFKTWALYEEFMSHKDGFITSKDAIKENLGFSDKTWRNCARELEDMGHLERYKKKGSNEWTFIFNEKAIDITAKKEIKEKFRAENKAKKAKTIEAKRESIGVAVKDLDLFKVTIPKI